MEGKPVEEMAIEELSEIPRSTVISVDNKIIKDFDKSCRGYKFSRNKRTHKRVRKIL